LLISIGSTRDALAVVSLCLRASNSLSFPALLNWSLAFSLILWKVAFMPDNGLEQYRSALLLLAHAQLARHQRLGLEASDLVQLTFAEACRRRPCPGASTSRAASRIPKDL
jgi:hypothetical protein